MPNQTYSLLLLLAISIGFTALNAVGPKTGRSLYLCGVAILGSAVFYREALPGFLLVNLAAYGLAVWLCSLSDPDRRWKAARGILLLLTVIFFAARELGWETYSPIPLAGVHLRAFTLDMWQMLRLVTLFWEVGSGLVTSLSAAEFMLWTALPLTLGGPVLRYAQRPGEMAPHWSCVSTREWWLGLASGAAKLAVGAGLVMTQDWWAEQGLAVMTWAKLATALVTGPLGFYFSIAGFYQIVENLGELNGATVPVSFNYPVGRTNLSDWWANWNITVTSLFRDYLFFNRWGLSSHNPYLNSIILFTMVGLWHAGNWYWFLWGALHGLFFAGFLFWRKLKRSLPPLPLAGTRIGRFAAAALTYGSVCLVWYLPPKLISILHL